MNKNSKHFKTLSVILIILNYLGTHNSIRINEEIMNEEMQIENNIKNIYAEEDNDSTVDDDEDHDHNSPEGQTNSSDEDIQGKEVKEGSLLLGKDGKI
ncbi:hypothetical protein FQA39_LY19277 [Lamprigera yunnana]|nr:hypothetical protein FQA39_LY19277 [Lamprigera yunnana]